MAAKKHPLPASEHDPAGESGDLAVYLEVASATARSAGQVLMDSLGQAIVSEKAPRDLVTQIDVQSQELIFQRLSDVFPDHLMLGEEQGTHVDWTCRDCWIVDPLDGTTNYSHNLPGFSVSIALFRDGKPLVGVVYDPWLDEMFTAATGRGAELNGRAIQPRDCRDLGRSLLVSSFPSTVTPETPELKRFNRVVLRATTRRLGSAALNFCYVACGRLDGYWASTLKIWDVAAGVLIAQCAGACCQHLTGGPVNWRDPQVVATGTTELCESLVPLLQIDDD